MSKNLNGFNPSVEDFLEEHKDITVIGLFWAGYWRFVVAFAAVAVACSVISAILNS